MSHYGSGKAAAEYWVKSVALEERENSLVRVFAVMPFAVRTPMVESVLAQRVHPVPQSLRDAADEGRLASPDDTAREIWDLIIGDVESGAVIPVGAVPAGMRT
jgi:NAD(P)-dependent dehydrogenase (short-subunit alcohol dehydrogenase family)